jgi:hypothetical protein
MEAIPLYTRSVADVCTHMAALVRIAALLVLAVLGSVRAAASDCPGSPICSDFWAADAVFVGRVRTLAGGPEAGSGPISVMHDPYSARIEVLEAFRGSEDVRPAAIVEVGAWRSLEPGDTYLVYAHKDEHGRLMVGTCGRTKELARAAEDLRFARALATDHSTAARVFGDVTWKERASTAPPRDPEERLPRVAWIAAGEGSEWRVESDARGHIEARLPPGRYTVRVEAPAEYTASLPWELEIPDPRACRRIEVPIDWRDSLSGRVVDAEGRPVAGLRVHMVTYFSGSWRPYNAYTDASGGFLFSDLGAGKHALYVGANILPTSIERTIHLEAGEHQILPPLTVPANTPLASIAGTVIDETGLPIEGALVELVEANGAMLNGQLSTGADGHYRFAAVPGRAYSIEARLPPPDYSIDSASSGIIEAGAAGGPTPIVVRRSAPASPRQP